MCDGINAESVIASCIRFGKSVLQIVNETQHGVTFE